MAELADGDRHALISKYITRSRINMAHINLARLMKDEVVDRVLTTNFDPLVMRASALFNNFPAVYDMVANAEFRPERVGRSSVFHLHGQQDGFFQAHLTDEVEKLFQRLPPLFEDSARRRTWLVAGYRGDNDPVFRQLDAMRTFAHDSYWIGYNDSPPSAPVTAFLDKQRNAYWVKGFDADRFFIALAEGLSCAQPVFISQPFTHLKSVLETIVGFSDPEQRKSISGAAQAFERIERAIGCIEPHDGCPREKPVPQPEPAPAPVSERRTEIAMLAMSEQWEAITARHDELLAIGDPAILNNLAFACVQQANRMNGEVANRLWDLAAECCAEVLALKPDDHKVLNNLGMALDRQARTKSGPEADRQWEEACDRYAQAVALKPDLHEAFNNWGSCLIVHSSRLAGREREDLLNQAEDKLQRANAIDPAAGLYNFACLAALRGDAVGCRSWLEKCRDAGKLPDRAHLESDSDMDLVRGEAWFADLLAAALP